MTWAWRLPLLTLSAVRTAGANLITSANNFQILSSTVFLFLMPHRSPQFRISVRHAENHLVAVNHWGQNTLIHFAFGHMSRKGDIVD